jgi:hypothetical protein
MLDSRALHRSRLTFFVTLPFALAICAVCIPLQGQASATIDIKTTSTTPVHSNFSGINDDVGFPG